MRIERIALFLIALCFLGVDLTTAQEKKGDDKKSATKSTPAESKESKKGESKAQSKPSPVTAIVGADIYTVTRGVIRGGVILVQDGKILKVGQDVEIPKDATTIDARGKIITPGFVALNVSGVAIRSLGGGPGGGGDGGGAGGNSARFADSLDPFDRNIRYCLGAGITTVCVEVAAGGRGRFGREPEGDETNVCPCCGLTILPTEPITPTPPTQRTPRRHAVLKLTYGELAPMLVKESPFYHLPAGAFSGPLNRHQWRETIRKARENLKNASTEGATSGGPPGRRGGASDEITRLVKKEIPLRTEAYSAEQIRDMIALARELDYNLVLDDVYEAWRVPGELSAANVSVIITPRSRRRPTPGREDSTGSSIETPGSLEKAGVPFAVSTLSPSVSLDGIAGRDLTSIALEACFAIRGGCKEQTALASLTIQPARMLGLADRIGSIEEGKDADLLILDGPPLDYRTYVEKAIVGGKVYYNRPKDRLYPDTPGRGS